MMQQVVVAAAGAAVQYHEKNKKTTFLVLPILHIEGHERQALQHISSRKGGIS
jgi:CDP-diacylglycerol pyrophosphatase